MNDSLQFLETPVSEGPAALTKLYEALYKVRAELPALPKTATGYVGKREIQYAPYRKVWDCIKTAVAKHGITVLQPLHSEDAETASITLIIAGHGAAIHSRLSFKRHADIKEFGAEVTYNKRYQLTSFFCLEGDPDADDYDVAESSNSNPVREVVPDSAQLQKRANEPTPRHSGGPNGNGKSSSEPASSGDAVSPAPKAAKDTAKASAPRSIGDRLTDVKQQLGWELSDFEDFCKKFPEDFPNFVSVIKLPAPQKEKLLELVVKHTGAAPF